MTLPDWASTPTILNHVNKTISHLLFVDEYGDTSFKNMHYCLRHGITPIEEDKRYLGLIGSSFTLAEHNKAIQKLLELKCKHWPPDGKHDKARKNIEGRHRVCLHASEIRRNVGPFQNTIINVDELMIDIGTAMTEIDFLLTACVVDKFEYAKHHDKNKNLPPAYETAASCLLQWFADDLSTVAGKGVVILERRGRKEDQTALDYFSQLISESTGFSAIHGIYFNPKFTEDGQKSYAGLEITDLCCKPLVTAAINGCEAENKALTYIKNKIRGYPTDPLCGLKLLIDSKKPFR